MAAPILTSASISSTDNGSGQSFTINNVTLSSSGNDRILALVFLGKDNTAAANAISTIVVDSAGVNSTIANGKVVRQGTRQLAQEGNPSSQCDVYFCLEANLPTSAGDYVVSWTIDADSQHPMFLLFEITGCPDQAYDNIAQGTQLTNVSAATKFSNSITPTVNDCLIVNLVATSHSSAPTFTTTQTEIRSTGNTSGGYTASQFTQATKAAKAMEQESSTTVTRFAWTILSFAGAGGGGGLGIPIAAHHYNHNVGSKL